MGLSPMPMLAIALGLAGLVLMFCTRKLPAPLPPGPKKKFLLGNIGDLPKAGQPEWEHWKKHKELYGPISSLSVLGQTIVIVSDYRAAFELLDKRNMNYSDRPVLKFCGEIVGWKLSLPLLRYGDRFRAYRKSFRQTIGTKAAVSRFQPLQTAEVRRFLLRVLEDPERFQDHIRTEAGAIILKLAYGYTIKPDGPDCLIDLAERAMTEFSMAAATGKWLVDAIPLVRYLPGWLPGMGFKKIAKQWNRTLKEFTERPYAFTKAQMESGIMVPSFIADSILNGLGSEEEELVMKHSALSMYAGGTDTTVLSIHCFFLTMALFPDIQKRAQDEIDSIVGTDRLPSFEDRPSLPYVGALVKEVFRWHTIVPMGFPHAASSDDVYNGMFIPKGSIIVPNIWLFTHDEANYKHPQSFNPDRFLGENAEMDPSMFVFGFGRRICPGKDLADESVFLTIASSLAAFDVRKARDSDGSVIEPRVGFTPGVVSRPLPFLCDIRPRSDVAAGLVREVEKDFPWEEGDDVRLNGIRWE